jgi:hypothetical protein
LWYASGMSVAALKRCTKCHAFLDRSEYSKDASKKDGLSARCRRCDNNKRNDWRRRNPDRNRESKRLWAQRNKDDIAKKNTAWKKSNPDRVRTYNLRRLQLEKNAPGGPYDPNRPDYQQRVRLYGGMCAYCGLVPYVSLEHGVPLSRGGGNWAANIFPVCHACNSRKHTKILGKEWKPPKAG